MRDMRILEAVYSNPWEILPAKLEAIVAVVEAHAAGLPRPMARGAREEQEARAAERNDLREATGIGVVPIHGTILPRSGELTEVSGIATTEEIRAQISALLENDRVGTIVLDIDSPGGAVAGIPELAQFIRESRDRKPIIAQAWHMAASAAYHLASQASEVVMTPSGEVGSIGVLALHVDQSKRLEDAGLKVTIFTSVEAKKEFNPFEPLTDEARKHETAVISDLHQNFVAAVADGRGVPAAKVNSEFGRGRLVSAKDALAAGMVDRVATFEETIERIQEEQSSRDQITRIEATLRSRRKRYSRRGTAALS